ncbi:MAG: TatD family hydrolase [Vibrio sp.]
MIDTHAHIYASEFDHDRDDMITRATQAGIDKILMPNIDLDSIKPMLDTQAAYPEICHSMMGLHPCYVDANYQQTLDTIFALFEQHSFIAVGEIGIDLYWDKTFRSEQIDAFVTQIKWAKQMNLPIVIHTRDSIEETLDVLTPLQDGNLSGVFHCFGGSTEEAKAIQGLGFHLGLGGVSTFKNSGMDKVIPELDLSRVILETDCPYLAPTPHRGKRNEPSLMPLVAQKIADCREMSLADVDRITTANAKALFNI